MSKPAIMVCLALFVLIGSVPVKAEEGARLYVDFSTLQSKKLFGIIAKSKVESELRLTRKQVADIAACEQLQPKNIPTLTNLLVQSRSLTNANERRTSSTRLWNQFDQYQLQSLFAILSASQSNRLQQLEWQVDGIKSLEHDQALAADLGLSEEQRKEIRDVFAYYEPILHPLYQRLGRQMIAGVSADETAQGRQEQVRSLTEAVTIIEKEKDRDLYRTLNLDQRELGKRLLGKPVSIHWDVEIF